MFNYLKDDLYSFMMFKNQVLSDMYIVIIRIRDLNRYYENYLKIPKFKNDAFTNKYK